MASRSRRRRVGAERRPIAADDLYRLRFVGDPQISPDGTRVAYTVTWADSDRRDRYHSRVMLVGVGGEARARPLTAGECRDHHPRWSPDGRTLAFLSDRDSGPAQLYVLSLEGGEPRKLTDLRHGAGQPVWSPDGSRIACAARADLPDLAKQEGWPEERDKQPRVRLITRINHKGDDEGFFETTRRHLFVVTLAEPPEVVQLTRGDWDASEPAWSPDGEQLAFVANRDRDRDVSFLSDVWAMRADGGRPRRVTRHRGGAASPAWSPDGDQIAYVGHERGTVYAPKLDLMLVPAEGGPSTVLSGGFDGDLGNVALTDTRDPHLDIPPVWAPDGRSLLALGSRAGRVSLLRFFPDGAPPVEMLGGDREVATFSVAADGGRLGFLASDPAHPYEVFGADADGTAERQLSRENAELLSELALVEPEPLSVVSSDGQTVHGWLLRPGGDRRRRRPLVLEVHGGPELMYAWSFMLEFQMLVGRGYGVAYTNPRGSRGYGEAFAARIFADWGGQDAADCLAAVEAASALPWVDAGRVGVAGGSYGGFMTAWLVGHSDRFAAAVAQRGCYNFASMYGTSDIGVPFCEYVFGGPLHELESLYRECSPLTHAGAIRTPLLLVHNERDLRCPIEQAEQLYVRLKRLGRAETELVRFPEENHNLSRSGRPDRRVERLERIVGWFDRWLR